jgi:hypothetical protein
MFVPLSVAEVKTWRQGTPWIIIPYRDNAEQERSLHLKEFVRAMKRHSDWNVLVIEQSDDGRKFNRGALLNIGARYAHKAGATYVIFHDVDLIPLAPIVPYYTAFPEHPIHIGKAWRDKYDYARFMGGTLSISIEDLNASNGFPNQFWGWGGEDDAIRERLFKHEIPVYQPIMARGYRELSHVNTSTKKEWTNERKRADVMGDTGRMGFRNVQWKVLGSEDLSPNVKKITVEL